MEKQHTVCPSWMGPVLGAPLRKLIHNPYRITKPYLAPGMTAIDMGCAMGFFTIPMAHLVGANGRVVAIDMQEKMLDGLLKKAHKAGVASTITPHLCTQTKLNLEGWAEKAGFALLFMMLHEVPDPERLMQEIRAALLPGGRLLLAEPKVQHQADYDACIKMIEKTGFVLAERPAIPACRAAVFQKQ